MTQSPGAIDEQRARGSLEPVARHGRGNGTPFDRTIDGDREGEAVLGHERGQRLGATLNVVVLEDAVEAEHHEFVTVERAMHALGLRERTAHAAGAEHLEDLDEHDTVAQRREVDGVAVDPALDVEGHRVGIHDVNI